MWTVAPPFYSILVASEFIGPNGHVSWYVSSSACEISLALQTRVGDLQINNDNSYMAGYVLYENNQPVRWVLSRLSISWLTLRSVLLINFMDDPSGAHDYTARIQTNGVQQASVRHLEAPNGLTSKFNISYAGQTVCFLDNALCIVLIRFA
jgi:hypothetical protein